MYGFDVSNLISVSKGKISQSEWSKHFLIIQNALCNWLYGVDLFVRYRTDSAPTPSVTDHLVVMWEGQRLDCNAMLSGAYWLSHPVSCTIKDDAGNVMPGFPKTKWLVAGIGQWTDFFMGVSLPKGSYTVDWSVCGKPGSHDLTVKMGYETTDIDIQIVVTDTAGVDPYAVWDAIKEGVWAEMLVYDATVKLKSAEIDGKYLIIFHLEVNAPPEEGVSSIGILPWAIYLALLAVFAFFAIGLPAISKIWIAQIAYDTQFRKLTYEDCTGTWNEWAACMADKYPVVWDKIKDKVKPPEIPEEEPDWMTYIMYIVLAVGAMAGVYILVKYVMPALKGRR